MATERATGKPRTQRRGHTLRETGQVDQDAAAFKGHRQACHCRVELQDAHPCLAHAGAGEPAGPPSCLSLARLRAASCVSRTRLSRKSGSDGGASGGDPRRPTRCNADTPVIQGSAGLSEAAFLADVARLGISCHVQGFSGADVGVCSRPVSFTGVGLPTSRAGAEPGDGRLAVGAHVGARGAARPRSSAPGCW